MFDGREGDGGHVGYVVSVGSEPFARLNVENERPRVEETEQGFESGFDSLPDDWVLDDDFDLVEMEDLGFQHEEPRGVVELVDV